MEYSKLVAVAGLPGLFELINTKTDGAIVRSLEDKSTRFVSSRIHSLSHLESIEVYTIRDNVNLVDVLNAMDSAAQKLPDEKDADAIKKYFEKVYPDLDFERVYASDMKKMIKWFSILKKNDIEIKLTELPEEEEEPVEEIAAEEPVVEKKPAAKEKTKKTAAATKTSTAKKKAAKKEEEKPEKKTEKKSEKKTEKKPAKKSAAKKK